MANAKGLAALAALGDPTRRQIFERLGHGPVAVGELAQVVPVSRPAVSQHLRVLRDAGLVTRKALGSRRIYRLDPRGIGAMRDWLEASWNAAFDAFGKYMNSPEGSDDHSSD
jgi:DNA-binding transcriptional ArsR family regulator